MSVSRLPIVNDLPPVVAESVTVTLQDLAISTSTSVANLSSECQRLYANVTGPGVELDDESFPDFSDALEYSIRTPGKICYNKLKAKASEFGDDPLMTYLRITLGVDGVRSYHLIDAWDTLTVVPGQFSWSAFRDRNMAFEA